MEPDKDQIDSEWMDDTLGELRLLWEKANNLKKNGLPTSPNARKKVEVEKENNIGKRSKGRVYLNPGKVNCKENTKSHIADVLKSRCDSSFHKNTDSNLKSAQETKASNSHTEQKAGNGTKYTAKVKVEPAENYCFNNRASSGVKFGNKEASHVPEDGHDSRTRHSVDTRVSNDAPSCNFIFKENFVNGRFKSTDKENNVHGESLFRNSKMTGETRVTDDDQMKNDVEAKKDPPVSNEAKTEPKGDGKKEDNVDMECFEELRLLWEKSNVLQKYGLYSDEYAKYGQQTSSSARQKVEVEKENKKTGKDSKDQIPLNPGRVNCKEKRKSRNAGVGKPRRNSTVHKKAPLSDSDLKSSQKSKVSNNNAHENASSSFTKYSTKETDNGLRFPKDNAKPHMRERYFPTNEASFGVNVENNRASYVCKEDFKSGCRNPLNEENIVRGEPLFANSNTRGQTRVTPVSKDSSFGDPLIHNEVESDTKKDEQQKDKEGPSHKEDGSDMDTFQDCLINDREKLKETDEYKRAVEEEWASRQHALQLQAEEAQKMRKVLKRKKAESERLLDVEKRQKQRVEEVRKTQKKDEDNMNMKDKLRAEVRMELQLLEKKSYNMASLLRGLGVQISGGLKPMPHEIRAAYKKALLSFHPDRALTSDIRKLVEAEEKFKLISRMKDKFLSSS